MIPEARVRVQAKARLEGGLIFFLAESLRDDKLYRSIESKSPTSFAGPWGGLDDGQENSENQRERKSERERRRHEQTPGGAVSETAPQPDGRVDGKRRGHGGRPGNGQ